MYRVRSLMLTERKYNYEANEACGIFCNSWKLALNGLPGEVHYFPRNAELFTYGFGPVCNGYVA